MLRDPRAGRRPARDCSSALASARRAPAGSDRCGARRSPGTAGLRAAHWSREDLTWDEVARIAVHAPELPGVDARFRPAARLSRRRGRSPMSWAMSAPSTRPSRPRTDDPLLQLPEFRIGKSGIERSLRRTLRGRAGLSRVEVNAHRPRDPRARPARGRARRRCPADPGPRSAAFLRRAAVGRAVRQCRGRRRAHRRRARPGLGAQLRPGAVHRRPAAERLGRAARRPAHAAGQQMHPRPVPAGLDLQDDDGAGGPRGRHHADHRGFLPRLHSASARPCSIAGRSTATAGSHGPGAGPVLRLSTSTSWPAGSASTPSPPWRTGSGSARSSASTCRASSPA